MTQSHAFFLGGHQKWDLKHLSESYSHNPFLKRSADDIPNTTVPNHSPPPPDLVALSPTLDIAVPTTPISSTEPSEAPSMGTMVLSIAVGCVAAFIIVPALAVLVFLYIRRWRNGGKPYDSIDGEHQDGYGDFPISAHHYHDEIQLKDYENESLPSIKEVTPIASPSFREVGTLASPASAVHVMPAFSRKPSADGRAMALGSSTIRPASG